MQYRPDWMIRAKFADGTVSLLSLAYFDASVDSVVGPKVSPCARPPVAAAVRGDHHRHSTIANGK
ncbi:hypothetical protein [Streptomyces sp. NPDC001530]|uniref:hypothetical protein n=1 Tax=Streptomyces sp. NPDC001530 TaxID=3364582 RepID=UPI0036792D39